MQLPVVVSTAILCFELFNARYPLLESTFFASSALLVLMALPGFALHWLVLRRLRSEHTTVWELLGRPNVVCHGSLRGGFAVMRFFRRGEFERIEDRPLVRVCRFYRVYTAIYSGLFALMFASFCVLAWLGR